MGKLNINDRVINNTSRKATLLKSFLNKTNFPLTMDIKLLVTKNYILKYGFIRFCLIHKLNLGYDLQYGYNSSHCECYHKSNAQS